MSLQTYDHTEIKSQINGIVLTDILDTITIAEDGDAWDEISGLYGTVVRSKNNNRLARVTYNFVATSPQLAALEALQLADERAAAGPFSFSLINLNGTYSLVGQGWIKSNRGASYGKAAGGRTVVISVYKEKGFAGQ